MTNKGTLLRTKDGQYDLTWLLTAGFFALIAGLAVASLFPRTRNPLAVIGILAGMYATTLLAAIPINKARVLKDATLPGSLVTGAAAIVKDACGTFGSATYAHDEDVRLP